jgi:hypothetical protein
MAPFARSTIQQNKPGGIVMLSWSKPLYVVVGSAVLLGCAASGGGGSAEAHGMKQGSGMKMTAASCMSQIDGERKQCEQQCPTATGNEHFSIQHKIAMENAACKEQCAATLEERAAQCKT